MNFMISLTKRGVSGFLSIKERFNLQSRGGFMKAQNNEIHQRSSCIVRPVQVLATLPNSITPGKSLGIELPSTGNFLTTQLPRGLLNLVWKANGSMSFSFSFHHSFWTGHCIRIHETYKMTALQQGSLWQDVLDTLLMMPSKALAPNAACYKMAA